MDFHEFCWFSGSGAWPGVAAHVVVEIRCRPRGTRYQPPGLILTKYITNHCQETLQQCFCADSRAVRGPSGPPARKVQKILFFLHFDKYPMVWWSYLESRLSCYRHTFAFTYTNEYTDTATQQLEADSRSTFERR